MFKCKRLQCSFESNPLSRKHRYCRFDRATIDGWHTSTELHNLHFAFGMKASKASEGTYFELNTECPVTRFRTEIMNSINCQVAFRIALITAERANQSKTNEINWIWMPLIEYFQIKRLIKVFELNGGQSFDWQDRCERSMPRLSAVWTLRSAKSFQTANTDRLVCKTMFCIDWQSFYNRR